MSWEKEEREKGITRREWVRVGMAAGAVGAVLGLGGLSIGQLLPPPLKSPGEIRETIQYTKFPPTDPTADLWWNSRAGTAVRVSDFDADWKGATGVWRGLFSNGQWVPGTGFPVLIIRIKREDQYFSVPPPEQVPGEIPPVSASTSTTRTCTRHRAGPASSCCSIDAFTCAAIRAGTS